MPLVWYQAYKMSICGDFLKSRYVYLLSAYIGMHKSVSIERVLSTTFGYPNQWAVVLILKVMLVVFGIGEYRIILHPKVGVWIRLVFEYEMSTLDHHDITKELQVKGFV
jgi:hypothetical protein